MPEETVRRAYAARVDEYVGLLGSVAEMRREDQELLASWASGIAGRVIDAGCGPGHWTAFLHERGLAVEGVDLVPGFIASAKQRFPDITYRVGDLNDLPAGDGALGAILAWYSLIHTAPDHVPAQLAEFARCLRPGGSLLIGFFEGKVLAPFDHAVVTAYYWPVTGMRAALAGAGFEVIETHTRADPGRRPHAAIVARRVEDHGEPTSSREA
jgi:ubiquinone/menaquinone biosynthesis C-methylase UbiE